MKIFKLIFLFLIAGSLPVAGQETKIDTIAEIEALFSDWGTDTPGGSVAVQRNGKMIFEKAYGLADLEQRTVNTLLTKFEAGSVSKQFTATAILQLIHEGKLSLEDDVRKYIPELPKYDKMIRVKHLLNHTSGLRDWGAVASIAGWPRTTRVYTQDHARDYIFRQKGLNNEPGEEYLYSNSNYTLLVTLVERISGQSLPDYTEEVFFKPLGMKNTEWRDDHREIIPGRATGYNKVRGEYKTIMPFENTYGHAALLTTVADLSIWNQSWLKGRLGKDLNELRLQKGKVLNDIEIPYAAGVFVEQYNGFTQISHSGATAGYRAWLAYYPEIDLSIAYISNDGSASTTGTGRRLIEIFAGKEDKTTSTNLEEVDIATFEDRLGLYKDRNSYSLVELKLNEGDLLLNGKELMALKGDTLVRGESKYFFKGANLFQATTTNPISYERVREVNPDEMELKEYIGKFSSEEAASDLEIQIKDGELVSKLTPSSEEKLKPAFTDGFNTHSRKLYTFKRNSGGKVTGIFISVPRAENVYFKKSAE